MTTSTTSSLKIITGWNSEDDSVAINTRKSIEQLSAADESHAYGTGDNQVQEVYAAVTTVTPSTPNADIDLSSITNVINDTGVSIAVVTEITVVNTSTAEDHLLIGGAASNPLASIFADTSDKVRVHAGGAICLSAPDTGYAVSGSSKTLRIAGDSIGADVTFRVVIKGRLS